jgi:hypothetical protein
MILALDQLAGRANYTQSHERSDFTQLEGLKLDISQVCGDSRFVLGYFLRAFVGQT